MRSAYNPHIPHSVQSVQSFGEYRVLSSIRIIISIRTAYNPFNRLMSIAFLIQSVSAQSVHRMMFDRCLPTILAQIDTEIGRN